MLQLRDNVALVFRLKSDLTLVDRSDKRLGGLSHLLHKVCSGLGLHLEEGKPAHEAAKVTRDGNQIQAPPILGTCTISFVGKVELSHSRGCLDSMDATLAILDGRSEALGLKLHGCHRNRHRPVRLR